MEELRVYTLGVQAAAPATCVLRALGAAGEVVRTHVIGDGPIVRICTLRLT